MSRKEFLDIIRTCRRRMDLAGFLRNLVFALGVGGGIGIVFQVLSFAVPFYYANVYTAIAMLSALVTAAVISLIRKNTMEHAALVMDSFGFQERIITAYEHLKDEGGLFVRQREDAMEQLRIHRDKIRIPLWPRRKNTVLTVALLGVMIGLAFIPSRTKDQAKELHQILKEAKAKEEEIGEVVEELEKLEESGREALTPEQLATLREMMESLESSMDEFRQASSFEALQAAGEKLDYKYGNMSGQMSDLAQSMANGAAALPMSAESMEAMADKLQEMSGNSSGNDSLASKGDRDGEGQDGESRGKEGQDGEGGGEKDGDGSKGGSDQDGGNGQGDSPDNEGNGSASGRGTGSTEISRDYVSIPNALADSGNLTGGYADHDNSEYFRARNGLGWEGTHMSHEAVIEGYERNAYEGIAAGRYPAGMENVIKDYFSGFN